MMDIRAEILDYINCNESTGALLLTGKWGCGKSFLVKQIAEKLNQEKTAAVAVVSLFGLDSISAINKRVKEEYLSFKLGTLGKAAGKITKKITTLAKDGLTVAGIASPSATGLSAASQGLSSALSYDIFGFIDVQNKVGKSGNKRNFVIVFDDLERCGISSKKDMLGAINEFVENKKIKVIIIAEEGKIEGDEYKEYKEKLVSRTLTMPADNEAIIKSILEDYSETINGYRNFLTQNQDLITQVFFESNSDNYRILKYILADFERVYGAWIESGITTENMKWALYTFGAEMFSSRITKQEDNTEKEKGSLKNNKEEDQYPSKDSHKSCFSSLYRWVYHGVWDKDCFLQELNDKYLEKNETALYRFLAYRFWDLQQKDIDEGFPEAVRLAYGGDLTKDQLISLIGKAHALNVNRIPLPVDIDYGKITVGLEKRKINIRSGSVNEPMSHSSIEANDVDEGAKLLVGRLKKLDDLLVAYRSRQEYISLLLGEGEKPYYSFSGICVEEFDDEWLELFIKKYGEVNNAEKRVLSISLLKFNFTSDCSSRENIDCSEKNFQKLADLLSNMETNDYITKMINESFIRKIREKSWNQ